MPVAQQQDGCPTPEINKEVDQTVFIEVARKRAHRCECGWVVGLRFPGGRFEGNQWIAVARSRNRRDRYKIAARIYIHDVVCKTIQIEIREGSSRAERRNPS